MRKEIAQWWLVGVMVLTGCNGSGTKTSPEDVGINPDYTILQTDTDEDCYGGNPLSGEDPNSYLQVNSMGQIPIHPDDGINVGADFVESKRLQPERAESGVWSHGRVITENQIFAGGERISTTASEEPVDNYKFCIDGRTGIVYGREEPEE